MLSGGAVLPLRAVLVGLAAQAVVLAVLRAGAWGWFTGVAFAAVTCGTLAVGLARTGTRSLGAANLVTLVRAALVGGVTALVVEARSPAWVVAVAALALAMDFADGQVARRTGTATPLGARFDMEIDAFLLLVLSVYVALSQGWWDVAIGAWRYLYIGAGVLVGWLRLPLPPSLARKTVAAVQGVALVVAASGLLPSGLAVASTATALAALTLSFLRDIGWQYRHR
ncbi:MAG TPA: CDP-alcohol phosphatidyltransferase family protein [Actinophytocola sp.]|uniref:CDP-alcohol phosphatidyltransferase family protein n=1 Tax=Actinophytocola sp. TaxID=1872138 RepID=UPI002F95E508